MRIKTKDKEISAILKQMDRQLEEEIELSVTLACVYVEKMSKEIIQTKLTNQLNAMNVMIHQIHPKLDENSKNYTKIKEQITSILTDYETVLTQFCEKYDEQIKSMIEEKAQLETKLRKLVHQKKAMEAEKAFQNKKHIMNRLMNKMKTIDVSLLNRIKDGQEVEQELRKQGNFPQENQEYENEIRNFEEQIKIWHDRIEQLHQQKIDKAWKAMEVAQSGLVTQIRKPKKLAKIKRFLVNRLNPYKVISKNVLEPIKQRIYDFKINELG